MKDCHSRFTRAKPKKASTGKENRAHFDFVDETKARPLRELSALYILVLASYVRHNIIIDCGSPQGPSMSLYHLDYFHSISIVFLYSVDFYSFMFTV